jgi:hypothetical protein
MTTSASETGGGLEEMGAAAPTTPAGLSIEKFPNQIDSQWPTRLQTGWRRRGNPFDGAFQFLRN